MKKEVTLVPKNKCILRMLVEMGEETKNSWIFLHRNLVEELMAVADYSRKRDIKGFQECFWNATDEYPKKSMWIELHPEKVWLKVYNIEAEDIAFRFPVDDPDNIFFMKREE